MSNEIFHKTFPKGFNSDAVDAFNVSVDKSVKGRTIIHSENPEELDTLNAVVSKVVGVSTGTNAENYQTNQDAVTVSSTIYNGNTTATVRTSAELVAYPSGAPGQGTNKWIGLAIATGESTIIGVNYKTYALANEDVAEATALDVPAGSFILWTTLEKLMANDVTFTISKTNKRINHITIKLLTD